MSSITGKNIFLVGPSVSVLVIGLIFFSFWYSAVYSYYCPSAGVDCTLDGIGLSGFFLMLIGLAGTITTSFILRIYGRRVPTPISWKRVLLISPPEYAFLAGFALLSGWYSNSSFYCPRDGVYCGLDSTGILGIYLAIIGLVGIIMSFLVILIMYRGRALTVLERRKERSTSRA